MTDAKLEALYQFLAGYWYDREEDDCAIVQEFLQVATPEEVRRSILLLRRFLEWPETSQRKAVIVRRAVWRWFPDDDTAPIEWLRNILMLLDRSLAAEKPERAASPGHTNGVPEVRARADGVAEPDEREALPDVLVTAAPRSTPTPLDHDGDEDE